LACVQIQWNALSTCRDSFKIIFLWLRHRIYSTQYGDEYVWQNVKFRNAVIYFRLSSNIVLGQMGRSTRNLNTVPATGFRLTNPWIWCEGAMAQTRFKHKMPKINDFYDSSWLAISWLCSEYIAAISRIQSTSTTHSRQWKIYLVHLPICQQVQDDNFSRHINCRRLCISLQKSPVTASVTCKNCV
jgi:hypothetical protein